MVVSLGGQMIQPRFYYPFSWLSYPDEITGEDDAYRK